MQDTIYRQAAIDAVIKRDANCGIDSAEVLKSLPPAQPEIVRCKDCKHWKQESICDGYCSEIEKDGFDEDDFCSYAERREA